MKSVQRYLPLLLLATGCASSGPLLYTKHDPTKHEVVFGIVRNRLSDVHSFGGKNAELFFSPQKIVHKNGQPYYQFIVQLRSQGGPYGPYLLIKPGQSMILHIDGKRFAYRTKVGSGPRRTKTKALFSPIFSESAVYENVSEADISRIARANRIEVEIQGKKQSVLGLFSEQNFAAFEALLQTSST